MPIDFRGFAGCELDVSTDETDDEELKTPLRLGLLRGIESVPEECMEEDVVTEVNSGSVERKAKFFICTSADSTGDIGGDMGVYAALPSIMFTLRFILFESSSGKRLSLRLGGGFVGDCKDWGERFDEELE